MSTPPYPNEVIIHPGGSGLELTSTVRLDQLSTVNRQRLLKRLGMVDHTIMQQVDQAIKASLGLVEI